MSIKTLISFLAIFSYFSIFSDKIKRESLLLPYNQSMEFYDGEPIKINKKKWDRFLLIWNKKIENTWKKIYKDLIEETGISTELLKLFMENEKSKDFYKILCKNKADNALKSGLKEKDIDPIVLGFIKKTLEKYTNKKNIKIILVPEMSILTGAFGSDSGDHYVLCQQESYSRENIETIYKEQNTGGAMFHFELTENDNNARFISIENLLTLGLTEAALHIEHESNLFSFILTNTPLNGKKASKKLSNLCHFLINTQTIFEAILQSKNPLEAALFLGKAGKSNKKDFEIWNKFINQLSNCYEQESLDRFEEIIDQFFATE